MENLTPEQIKLIKAQKAQLERKALFATCVSKEHLRLWIKRYLDVDMPDVIVCDDDVTNPPSNSSPMDLIWEIYQKALDGRDEKFQKVLAYAARDSFKTLSASILEILCLFHLRRDVAHMAAIESQAQKAASYVGKYLKRPLLRDFVDGNNKREIRVLRYEDRDGNVITPAEWEAMDSMDQNVYEPITNYIKIIIATLAGANSEHVSFMVLDELDLAPPAPVEEAKMIPAPGQVRKELPITFMTSTRKFAFGLVQQELDKGAQDPKYNLNVRHWNLIDVTEPCQPARHLPEEGKIPIYYSEQDLNAISEAEYKLLSPEEKDRYYEGQGWKGCLQNCSLFAVCRGRLATKQTGNSKMLKPIPHTINVFKSVSPQHAKAQLMCWKPSSEGLIYPNFSRERHMLTASEMAEKITGEKYPQHFTKADLIQLMINRGMEFHSGMDFGYTHNWSVVTGGKDGHRLFLFDVIALPAMELMEKIEHFKSKLGFLNPMVYPDPAYPSDIKSFKKWGVRCKNFVKDVLGGIESVRSKLMPGLNREPEIYLLKGDPGCDYLAQRLSQYHWKLDTNGKPTDVPDDDKDDECFTDKTEVLTRNGWISLRDVTDRHEVMAVTQDGAGFFDLPKRVIRKKYSGKMYRINHPHLEFEATVNHPHAVMTQMNWKVKSKYWLEPRPISEQSGEMYWANNLKQWPSGAGYFRQGEDEAWLAGFWLAEGCFDIHRPSYIIVDQTKESQKSEVRDRASRLGWRWSETRGGGGAVRFVFSEQSERASGWREVFGAGSDAKRLPMHVIEQMTEAERRAMWEGYMSGDGCRTGSGWHFDSISKDLIEGVQVLTLSLGYGCRIVSYDSMRAGRIMTNPQGRSYVTAQSYRGHVLRKKSVAHIKKSRFESFEVQDLDVYCVTTTTGYFLARTNGKPFVAKNCDALRYLCQNLFGNKTRLAASVQPLLTDHNLNYRYNQPTWRQDQHQAPVPEFYQNERIIEPTTHTFLTHKIQELLGTEAPESGERRGKRGSFIFDL